MNLKSALLGVLAGSIAGASLGVLFAPKKGSKTRKDISKKRKKIIKGFKNQFDDLLESMNEKFEEAKGNASEFVKQKGK